MPKMNDRERLAKLEADQRNIANEAETVRRALRGQYGKLVSEQPVERLSEREFRDLLVQGIRVGGGAAVAALKGLPTANTSTPAVSNGRQKKGAAFAQGAAGDAPSE